MRGWLSIFVCGACALLSSGAVAQQPLIEVSPNIQVSKSRNNLVHNEVLLAADPTKPKNLLGCSMAFSPEQNKVLTIAYISLDGGNSWQFAVQNDRAMLSADPSCVFGRSGTVYFTAIERTKLNSDQQVIYRSSDYGKTWNAPEILFGSAPAVDRTYVISDNRETNFQGRIYLYGQIAQPTINGEPAGMSIALWRSENNGESFKGPTVRSADSRVVFHPANGVVLSDGSLVCLLAELDSQKRNDGFVGSQYRKADQKNGTLKVLVSPDGGETFSPAIKVSDMYEDWRQESNGLPSIAVDSGSAPFKDRLYAVWADGRYGRTQILLSYSADKGKSWSTPHLISDSQPRDGVAGPDSFMPVVAVNAEGIVGVMWYDRRDDPNTIAYHVRFAASLDGGDTWSNSVRVSEAPKTFETLNTSPIRAEVWGHGPLSFDLRRYEWLAGGHTAGMAADAAGIFHPLWVDNRTGLSQIWTAAVHVKGTVSKNGSTDLASLDDISGSVTLEMTKCSHETVKNFVQCTAQVKNTSRTKLTTPIKLRVIGIRSELGEPRIQDADNGLSGVGAIWDFSRLIRNDSLGPGESSESRQLRFEISNLRPVRQGNYFATTLVVIDARVFGHSIP